MVPTLRARRACTCIRNTLCSPNAQSSSWARLRVCCDSRFAKSHWKHPRSLSLVGWNPLAVDGLHSRALVCESRESQGLHRTGVPSAHYRKCTQRKAICQSCLWCCHSVDAACTRQFVMGLVQFELWGRLSIWVPKSDRAAWIWRSRVRVKLKVV